MNKYSELLLDPRWQKKRLQILERDKFTCLNCNSSKKTLHVHHSYYVKNRKPWEYPNYSLSTLCLDCHKEENSFREIGDLESRCTEFELSLDLLFNGKSQLFCSPLLWEISCVANGLQNNLSSSEIEIAIFETLLKLWKNTRTDYPPIWLCNENTTVPWATEWMLENFGKHKNE